jgi:hypothetical protein
MYYNALERFCQVIVSNNPILCVVIGKEYFSTICAALYLKYRKIAKLTAICNAHELAGREVWAFVACILCGFG